VAPHPGQSRVRVLHLRQLDLQLRLVRLGARGEDVEDQLRAVQHLDAALVAVAARRLVDDLLQRADLTGRKVVVEDDDVRLLLLGQPGDLLGLTAADVRAGIDAVALLEDLADDFRAGGVGEGAELAERVARVGGRLRQDHADEHRLLLADGQFGSFQFGQSKWTSESPRAHSAGGAL
jgi:hypothetical protein